MKHVLLLIPLALAACAESARVEQMTVSPTEIAAAPPALAGKVCVESVTGGEETNPLWTSEVDNDGFRGALERSLSRGGYGAGAAPCGLGLSANLLGLAQPVIGLDMEVTANVNYSVRDTASDAPYFATTVVSPYTAKFSDSLLGVRRLQLANEGAVKANIARFLDEFSEHAATNPPPPPAEAEGAPSS